MRIIDLARYLLRVRQLAELSSPRDDEVRGAPSLTKPHLMHAEPSQSVCHPLDVMWHEIHAHEEYMRVLMQQSVESTALPIEGALVLPLRDLEARFTVEEWVAFLQIGPEASKTFNHLRQIVGSMMLRCVPEKEEYNGLRYLLHRCSQAMIHDDYTEIEGETNKENKAASLTSAQDHFQCLLHLLKCMRITDIIENISIEHVVSSDSLLAQTPLIRYISPYLTANTQQNVFVPLSSCPTPAEVKDIKELIRHRYSIKFLASSNAQATAQALSELRYTRVYLCNVVNVYAARSCEWPIDVDRHWLRCCGA